MPFSCVSERVRGSRGITKESVRNNGPQRDKKITRETREWTVIYERVKKNGKDFQENLQWENEKREERNKREKEYKIRKMGERREHITERRFKTKKVDDYNITMWVCMSVCIHICMHVCEYVWMYRWIN